MSALLEVRGLAKRFGGLVATDGLNLDVAAGEIHALIVQNGAGKTTAIGQIAGEIRPDAGTIHLAGQDITQLGVPARVIGRFDDYHQRLKAETATLPWAGLLRQRGASGFDAALEPELVRQRVAHFFPDGR